MWGKIAHILLRYRIFFLALLVGVTCFMAWQASKIELSYEFVKPLPQTDSALIEYEAFKKMFGEDGNVMVIGLQDSSIFKLENFLAWDKLGKDIKKVFGIKEILSIANLYNVTKNDSLKKFDFKQILASPPKTQEELDSVKKIIWSLPFYDGLAINKETHASLMAITFDDKQLNSKARLEIVAKVKELADSFSEKTKIELHFSGMPYIRTQFMKTVSNEMFIFLFLAIAVTAIILFIFFRSFRVVAYSLVVVIIGIIWSLGTLQLFGYKITILTGLIPPLITVIGLPNCIFFTNKYQEELRLHGIKLKAITMMVKKVGLSNFLANVTTAVGFGVFYFTNSSLLVEFGVVAAINVIATYIVALVLLTIVLSLLPVPSLKKTKHLDRKRLQTIISKIDFLVHKKRMALYIGLLIVTIIGFIGMFRIQLIGYVVDDLPKDDPIYTDLRFFEKNFHGVLPFEILIDTKEEKGVFQDNAKTLYKIRMLQKVVSEYPEFSKPISVVEALRFAYQAYKEGKPKFYQLPPPGELAKLNEYIGTVSGQENKFKTFLDSSRRYTRVSFQMADVGSVRIKELVKEIKPRIDSIFNPSEYHVSLTGHSLVFLKGNDYLFHHLFISLGIAIILIVLIGMVLFRSVLIIVLSKIPCLVPLVITAGIMGFFGIPFKPSTILIFSIAFGLASDGTIYILTEYRLQLNKGAGPEAISRTIKEVGISMIYTNIILFFGFAIFIVSSFGGTVAMGILISITLICSLATNLVMLPSILLSLEKRMNMKNMLKDAVELEDNEEEESEESRITN
ncbi:MAG: patched family protein [Bacteroidetes bacterium RIFOXYA12_FULL_35_11]|nr:MAG: patched family protein [Bacteroidetes bacterium GWF2_35_48]OFY75244.1 MAG: patched family protein [Bacteroidetes bacterium RIFOXYA12_FULL_35_11]OFY96933.1 MAG: patched family protein [Bacteroidetes bacterium RIFOXYB2_FULL_35_7]OFY97732.1 MAG: patched family protein [Bacteroidetes bacterium RIFOXYC12_FULL_35_7]